MDRQELISLIQQHEQYYDAIMTNTIEENVPNGRTTVESNGEKMKQYVLSLLTTSELSSYMLDDNGEWKPDIQQQLIDRSRYIRGFLIVFRDMNLINNTDVEHIINHFTNYPVNLKELEIQEKISNG